tara:strand:- start:304 stop:465 length:162 start_codon:yes stop_codon:yes gene_type:complete
MQKRPDKVKDDTVNREQRDRKEQNNLVLKNANLQDTAAFVNVPNPVEARAVIA